MPSRAVEGADGTGVFSISNELMWSRKFWRSPFSSSTHTDQFPFVSTPTRIFCIWPVVAVWSAARSSSLRTFGKAKQENHSVCMDSHWKCGRTREARRHRCGVAMQLSEFRDECLQTLHRFFHRCVLNHVADTQVTIETKFLAWYAHHFLIFEKGVRKITARC